MSGDIVERLRALAQHDDLSIGIVAADEIEQLTRERNEARSEVDRLRKEMREIAGDCESEYPSSYKKIAWFIRNALEAKP